MILNKTTTYAIRVLIFMATDEREKFSAQYLYENLKISNRYLRRLMTDLTKHGFIASNRGRNGGFLFARELDNLFLSEIIHKMEGPDLFQSCILGMKDCKLSPVCAMHEPWLEIRTKMMTTFSATSLQQIRNSNKK